MTDIPKIFGSMVFNREVMRQRLSSDVYERLIDVIENGGEMEKDVADAIDSTVPLIQCCEYNKESTAEYVSINDFASANGINRT